MGLTKEQISRYRRQLILPEIGVPGQERLLRSAVLIVGAGGLGWPAALYLAAAGVGRIGVLDQDAVALSNLHRQVLHAAADVGRPKARVAAERLQALNPGLAIVAVPERLTAANAPALVQAYDLVVDGSDNFPTRYLVNDACVLFGRPLVHGGVVGFGGQLLTVLPRRSACVRCVFPEPPSPGAVPSCQEAGILGSVAGILGTLMAHEALKVLLGLGAPMADRLLVLDGLAGRFREVLVRRDAGCAVCGDAPSIRRLTAEDESWCANAQEEGRWHGNKSR